MKPAALIRFLLLSLMIAGILLSLAAPAQADTIYIVRKGDSLSTIARMFGVSPWAIAQANGITNLNRIYVGQRLIIPGVDRPPPSGTTYTVQRGDSLWRIATRFGLTVNALKTANNLKSNVVYVGQVLVIPGKGGLTPGSPKVIAFNVVPTTKVAAGQPVSASWETVGDKAELCWLSELGPTRCEPVMSKGSTTVAFDHTGYTGLGLRVTTGEESAWVTSRVQFQCATAWFFANPPEECPAGAPTQSQAAAEYFENGFMIWIESGDDYYIFYTAAKHVRNGKHTFERSAKLSLKPGASRDNRVSEKPPAGYYEPVSGFGLIWRGEVNNFGAQIRSQLGWATAPEFGFKVTQQCKQTVHPRTWTCYLSSPNGKVLRLWPESTAEAGLLWEER